MKIHSCDYFVLNIFSFVCPGACHAMSVASLSYFWSSHPTMQKHLFRGAKGAMRRNERSLTAFHPISRSENAYVSPQCADEQSIGRAARTRASHAFSTEKAQCGGRVRAPKSE